MQFVYRRESNPCALQKKKKTRRESKITYHKLHRSFKRIENDLLAILKQI